MDFLFKLGKPFLHALDPEDAHSLTIKGLKTGLFPPCADKENPHLKQNVAGIEFQNPVGIAAGFDKNAEVIAPALGLSIGFIEVGGITPHPQEGLPRPRIFRDPSNEAVINKMNFPNVGLAQAKKNIESFRRKHPNIKGRLGIQIAMTSGQTEPEKDFKLLLSELGPLADYVSFNISCPNTPGLRNLQNKDVFSELAKTLLEHRNVSCPNKPPLFAKFSPDLSDDEIAGLAQAGLDAGLDGAILTNTTTARPDTLPADFAQRQGGLSGRPLTQRSTEVIRKFYAVTQGRIAIIGLGGISSAREAYDKIRAGANIVQLYTALVYQGPGLIKEINKGLAAFLETDGFDNISQAVGADHR